MKRTFPDNITRRSGLVGARQVPDIDGSQAAFIGVVVALSVVIVVCCVAVFYLLRHHEPTEQDRAARRERYRRAREQTLHSSSTLSPPALGSPPGSGSFGDKVKRVWQSTTSGRRGGRGWIRAGSNDDWAARSKPNRQAQNHHGVPPGAAATPPNLSLTHDQHFDSDPELGGRPPVPDKQDPQIEGGGIRIVDSPSSEDSASGYGPVVGQQQQQHAYVYAYADPFPKTSSDGAVLQRSQSPLSVSSSPSPSPGSSPRERASMSDGSRGPHSLCSSDDRRHRSGMSNGSAWTHGSKFVEDI